VFGSVELRLADRPDGPQADGNLILQWQRVRAWIEAEDAGFRACIAAARDCGTYEHLRWRSLIVGAEALPPMGRLHAVNRYFNQWPYLEDSEIYGADDYWATPLEFARQSGDCEDFAIAKFMALRHLGFANAALRIVIITDQIRRKIHAVLAVYLGGDILILDSLSNGIFSDRTYQHYIPHYSMNEPRRPRRWPSLPAPRRSPHRPCEGGGALGRSLVRLGQRPSDARP
jgi:predicted transglutaminase-like cysteine proteinase